MAAPVTAIADVPPGPLARDLEPLPVALAALLRHRRAAPLSLLRDLLALTGGVTLDGASGQLAANPRMRMLAALRWPVPARVSLVLLLLRDFDNPDFAPPAGASPSEVRFALLDALAGPATTPQAPPPPLALLWRALEAVEDRLLTLLHALGPEACAQDPDLPLRMLPQLPSIQPMAAPDRHLLSLSLPSLKPGQAHGTGTSGERAGFAPQGSYLQLVPSQWALPDKVRQWRALNGGLLYRLRTAHEPPRLPPAILLLDGSPCCFGPVEVLLRSAAFALGRALLDACLASYLVVAGGEPTTHPLTDRADLLAILTARSPQPASAARALARAGALRETLRGSSPLEPLIILLTHPWFGAEEDDLPRPPHLRGLFVPYPRHPVAPVIKDRCERWFSLPWEQGHKLADTLAALLA